MKAIDTPRRAIIDIGSNTVRLVVYGEPLRAPVVLLNEKVTARLGREVAKSGMLSAKAMATALSALARHAAMLRLMEVDDVQVVATAAVRDAANGAAFLEQVAALGLSPRLLSGKEEAQTSAFGVLAAFPSARGIAADLGGGSLELTEIGRDGAGDPAFGHGVTLPLGTLRLPALRAGGEARLARALRTGLEQSEWTGGAGEPLFLVGGSLRAFAIHAMQQLDWPIDDPHGFEIAPAAAQELCRAIVQGKLAQRPGRVSASRLASLPDAAALLDVLVERLAPSRLVFSSWGLREGLLYSRLDTGARSGDPMVAGVTAFVEGFGISAATGAVIAGWTAGAAGAAGTGPEEENLRLAACLLALAAMRSEPNFRAEEAMDWALRKRWIGIDARDRAMLAAAVAANSGGGAPRPGLARLASEADLHRAATWGLAIRLCRKLTGGTPGAIAGSALEMVGGVLVLRIGEPLHALLSDSVAKALRQLAERIGLDCRVELEPA